MSLSGQNASSGPDAIVSVSIGTALLEAAPIGIYVVDAGLRLRTINRVARRVFGEVGGDAGLEGQDFEALVHRLWPDDAAAALLRPFREVLEEGRAQGPSEFTGLRRDRGVLEHYEWSLSPIDLADGSRGVVCYFRDISGDVRARRAVVESQESLDQQRRLYEAILNNTPDLAYVFGLDHRFVYANEGLLKMWGKSWEEAAGRNCLELGYEPWHAEMHDREIEQVVATRLPVRGEVPFEGTFGRRIYDYIMVPVLNEKGEVEAVAGTTRDVTDIRRSEQVLREADRRKDEFLATLAHELRNPLAPLRNGLGVLKLAGERAPLDPATLDEVHEMMDRQLDHLVRLVDDLMEVSRITRGKVELRRELVALPEVLAAAVDTCRPHMDAARHHLEVALPDENLGVEADPVRLAQVFGNLLNNAAKYTGEGGLIAVRAWRDGGEAVVSVSDNGCGIPPDALPSVFDLFMQARHSHSRAQGGLGIGLTLVRSLVEMHGGRVEARSDGEGRGSEFLVRLPLALAGTDAAGAVAPGRADCDAIAGRRFLVVDDNHDAAESLGLLLRSLGADVKVVHDGRTALFAFRNSSFDAAVIDLGMPEMDGYELARRLRSEPGGDLPLIALTGWGQKADRRRSLEAGIDHHLVKPVASAELSRVLGVELERRGRRGS